MIKIPSSMQLQQMQEIEEGSLSEAETDKDETEISDAQFRIHVLQGLGILRELRPAVEDLLSWVGCEPAGRSELRAMQAAEKRVKDLLAAFELDPE